VYFLSEDRELISEDTWIPILTYRGIIILEMFQQRAYSVSSIYLSL
jgi:hypothetical protein